MNSKELKELLKQHELWLKSNGKEGTRAELSGANLGGANLEWANLEGADLGGANLSGADLWRANLRGVDLRWANLREANFREANLRWADLRRANLREADLRGADLEGADLREADLENIENKFIYTFSAGKHFGYYADGYVKIGCLCLPLSEWREKYKEIGVREGYSEEQIALYGSVLIETIPQLIKIKEKYHG